MSFDRSRGRWSRRLFNAEPAAGEPGGRSVVYWLTLGAGGLTFRSQNCGPYNSAKQSACNFVVDCQNPFREVVCGLFFSLEVPSSCPVQMYSRMYSVQKCTSQETGTEPTCKVPERLLRTSGASLARRPPTNAMLSRVFKVLVTHWCECNITKPVGTDSPPSTTRSSFNAFAFTLTHIVRVTAKGAATTLAISSSSMLPARRSPKQRRRTERNVGKNP